MFEIFNTRAAYPFLEKVSGLSAAANFQYFFALVKLLYKINLYQAKLYESKLYEIELYQMGAGVQDTSLFL